MQTNSGQTIGAVGGPLKRLVELGQSPWIDFIDRSVLDGELKRMIDEWGVRGMTSNPTIFEHAITRTHAYDDEIDRLERERKSAEAIYETLALEDLRAAADRFEPVYRATGGRDGFVSFEVSPHLARDCAGTIAAARRLWSALDRPNTMIKVPGTRECLPAIRELTAAGLNVNITLLFSVERYAAVLDAYLGGLEDALAAGRRIDRIASVASFFLSRIDTAVDRELDALAKAGPHAQQARELRGKAAIASAGAAYRVLEQSLASPRFRALRERGGHVQRLLWASTSTKDPSYPDVKYVEALIGPHSVNTMPLETLRAYDDHGEPEANRIEAARDSADRTLAALAAVGVDLDAVTERLLVEGIDKFAKAYDDLLAALDRKRQRLAAGGAKS